MESRIYTSVDWVMWLTAGVSEMMTSATTSGWRAIFFFFFKPVQRGHSSAVVMSNPERSLFTSLSPYLLKVFLGLGVLQFSGSFERLTQLQTFVLNTPQWKQKPGAYRSRHLQKPAKHVTALAVFSAGFHWMACWWGGRRYAVVPRRQSPALLLTAAFIWR